MFPKEIIEKTKELGLYGSNSPKEKSRLLKMIFPYVKNAREEGASYNTILEKISKAFEVQYALPSFMNAVKKIEKEAEKAEENVETKDTNIKEKKFILLANDKGGVGKTTLATLLNLPNSLILNLDKTREIADIYPYKKIVDFGKVEEEEGVELEDFLAILKEDENFDNIIIDTKGGITEDLLKILPYIDVVIVPIKVGTTSEQPSYEFIVQLNSLLEEFGKDNINWAIVYNEISPKFLKKVGLGKFELLDEFKKMENSLKEDVLGDKLKAVTYFKRSEAVTTREREKQDIDVLMKKNFGAYLVVKKEIDRLNKELEKVIKGKDEE
jgi:cellulose biosynthesis protein BcsQ